MLFWDVTQRTLVVFFTDFLGRPVCLFFKRQVVEDSLTFEDGADRLSRNFGKRILRNVLEELGLQLRSGGSLKSRLINIINFNTSYFGRRTMLTVGLKCLASGFYDRILCKQLRTYGSYEEAHLSEKDLAFCDKWAFLEVY